MVNALFIETPTQSHDQLITKLLQVCPNLNNLEKTSCPDHASDYIAKQKTNLVFLPFEKIELLNQFPPVSFELICIGENKSNAFDAVGFLIPPYEKEELALCVNNAIGRLKTKMLVENKNDQDNLLGIPTMEGLEFFSVKNIIRCEGFQKCTRLVTVCKSKILSSYNIGEFKKILIPFNFYMPHKSFLINLSHIKKYHKEGTIIMSDGQGVPVSRRKKQEFLKRVFHL